MDYKCDDYQLARALAVLKSALLIGFVIGGYRGGRRAALQFMAETQHSLPGIKTRREAAAYWKLRHARTIVGAAKEGCQRGLQLTSVAMVFVGTRWVVEQRAHHFRLRVPETVAGVVAGSMFALAAPTEQRWRYLGRGILMGGGLGFIVSLLRLAIEHLEQRDSSYHSLD